MIKKYFLSQLLIGLSFFAMNTTVLAENAAKVVTTIQPISLLTAEILGTEQNITTLVSGNNTAHHYQLKPSHMHALENADLVIWVGHSLENFMSKVIKNLKKEHKPIITLDQLPKMKTLRYRSHALWDHDDHGHHHHHHHSNGTDGHLWLSPDNAIVMAEEIERQLSLLFPEKKSYYQKNLIDLIDNIKNFDKKNRLRLAAINTIPYLVYHDAFQYFESHYGLNAKGAFITESNQSLSAKRLRTLNKLIKTEDIKCIFSDQQYDTSIPNKVAKHAGITTLALDPMGSNLTLSDGGYVQLLETISKNMLSCLNK